MVAMMSAYFRRTGLQVTRCIVLMLGVAAQIAICAEDHLSLADKEQLQLQRELSWLTTLMWGLVIALVLFAVAIRYIARRTTHPCHWCAEFIPNKEEVCPRCGMKK